jgi:hypothetical protein
LFPQEGRVVLHGWASVKIGRGVGVGDTKVFSINGLKTELIFYCLVEHLAFTVDECGYLGAEQNLIVTI